MEGAQGDLHEIEGSGGVSLSTSVRIMGAG